MVEVFALHQSQELLPETSGKAVKYSGYKWGLCSQPAWVPNWVPSYWLVVSSGKNSFYLLRFIPCPLNRDNISQGHLRPKQNLPCLECSIELTTEYIHNVP